MGRQELSYGSQGRAVEELQELLNKNGASLKVDGIFGADTVEQLRIYQQNNDLDADGIAGEKTWASLLGGTDSSTNKFQYNQFSYNPYTESDIVANAKNALDAQLSQKPGEYKSQWQTQLDDTINKIMNREKFSYDLNGDALYQQYKDKYIQQGKMAMQDTMGQASAMTGGYGNSYAQSVGQQAYNASLEQLNDVVPELYQMAYDRYNQEGQDLYNQYSMLGAQEDQDYGRYRDSVSDYQTERDYLTGRYDSERQYDYNKYAAERDFAYGKYADDKSYAYNEHRNAIADQQWEDEFYEGQRQFNENLALQKKSSVASSKSTSKKEDEDEVEDEGGYKAVTTEGVNSFKASIRTSREFGRGTNPDNQKYKTYEAYVEGKLDQWLEEGKLTEEEVATLIAYYNL